MGKSNWKKLLKRSACITMGTTMLLGILSGCGKESTSDDVSKGTEKGKESNSIKVSAKGELPIVNDPITLRVFMAQDLSVTDYVNNKFTKFMEEQTGIHIEWELATSDDRSQKLNLMLSSGEDLPDIIMGGMDSATLVEYADQGMFIPINQYMDTQSAYYKDILNQYKGLEQILTAPDGKMYSVQQICDSIPNSYPIRAWINQDWLDKLNLEMPATKEDFIDVLRAFKTKDPNGNGINDEIPIMGATNGWHTVFDQFAITNFIPYAKDNPYVLDKDENITAVYATDAYREGLTFLNQLVTEELYDPVSYTQDIEQLKQAFEDGLVGVIPGGGPNSFANMSGDRYHSYVALEPMDMGNGDRIAMHQEYSYLMYTNTFVITKDCKYPEAAFKWADYMFKTEVSMRSRLGEPGIDWTEAKDGEMGVNGETALYSSILKWGDQQNSHWAGYNPYFENFADKVISTGDKYELQQYLWDATIESYQPYTMENSGWKSFPPLMYSPDASKKINEINATLNDFVDEYRAKFVTGVLNPKDDSAWASYIEELDKIGYKEGVKLRQERYDELYKK